MDARGSIKGLLATRSKQAATVRIEAACDMATTMKIATLKNGVWTLEGKVGGFCQDASERHPLRGDIVKLSAFDNAISIVQDGAVALAGAEKAAS